MAKHGQLYSQLEVNSLKDGIYIFLLLMSLLNISDYLIALVQVIV